MQQLREAPVRFVSRAVALMLSTLLCLDAAAAAGQGPADIAAIHRVAQEVEIAHVLDALSHRAIRGDVVFRDVSTVDVVQGRTLPHRTVIVSGTAIKWVGDAASAPTVDGASIVDGKGLFLSPGLTDMHVHTRSLAEQLLRLATGTTAVRDMSGFPWMLRLRRAGSAGRLPMPVAYIAGTIIADQPLGGFAVVVQSDSDARRVVRDQAACGYDFVKVHNSLALNLFDAVADEARRVGKDLVGHVPHGISLDHAIHAGGMRTIEHLKGFIDDRTLAVSDEDYASAMHGTQLWLTPTFYVMRGITGGELARRELMRPEMRYVPMSEREAWRATTATSPDWRARLAATLPSSVSQFFGLAPQARLQASATAAMARLLPLHPRWLAGTDSARQDFQIPGYALLDELRLMKQHGIGRADVLRAATSEPALAMRRANEFGRIAPGLRADLVLLPRDPLRELSAFRDNRGVMANGLWLDRANLDEGLGDLARVEAEPDASYGLDRRSADALAAQVATLSAQDIALDPMLLLPAAGALRSAGYGPPAATLSAADTDNAPGPCNHPAAPD